MQTSPERLVLLKKYKIAHTVCVRTHLYMKCVCVCRVPDGDATFFNSYICKI